MPDRIKNLDRYLYYITFVHNTLVTLIKAHFRRKKSIIRFWEALPSVNHICVRVEYFLCYLNMKPRFSIRDRLYCRPFAKDFLGTRIVDEWFRKVTHPHQSSLIHTLSI